MNMKKLSMTALLSISLAMPMMTAMVQTAHANSNKANNNLTASKNLNSLLSNVKSMSANFSQTTSGSVKSSQSVNSANRSFSGTMQVQRPNQFRWQIAGSSEQLIVANGNTLWIYDKDLEQVTRQKVDNQVGNTPALLLSGDPNKISENFTVTQPNPSKNYYVLYPKSQSSNFKSLGIAFNSGNPVMMVLDDNLGQTTSIRFSNVKRNGKIPASQFNFTPPKGVDVIDQ